MIVVATAQGRGERVLIGKLFLEGLDRIFLLIQTEAAVAAALQFAGWARNLFSFWRLLRILSKHSGHHREANHNSQQRSLHNHMRFLSSFRLPKS